jgi:3-isopropylmalate/(R)-2-methylmalate dehydratase small subunit
MEPFVTWTAIAAPIDERNLDTNQLCPTRFNKIALGDPFYPKILFNNQRFTNDTDFVADHALNCAPFCDSGIFVADENFGCGSSRESAVYALLAFGVRCVIAPSFGDIFYNNSTKNGLLPVRLDAAICDALRASLNELPGSSICVDLMACTATASDGVAHPFDIHSATRHAMLEGLDDVGVTMDRMESIEAFEQSHRRTMPWIFKSAN